MPGWQITAKTIYCDAVDDEVTLLVYKNGSARCTGFKKYTVPNSLTLALVKEKNRRLKRQVKCEGEGCRHLVEYKHKILVEET